MKNVKLLSLWGLGAFLFTVLYSCSFDMESLVVHPSETSTYRSFNVEFRGKSKSNGTVVGRGYFGALLPKGWTTADYTNYKIIDKDKSVALEGSFCFDQYYTDHLISKYNVPEGYYWWGGRSIDEISMTETQEYSFRFKVFTDDQVGSFKLNYMIARDTGKGEIDEFFITNEYEINVKKGNKYPSPGKKNGN